MNNTYERRISLSDSQNMKIAQWLGLEPNPKAYRVGFQYNTWDGFRLIIDNGPSQTWWEDWMLWDDSSQGGLIFYVESFVGFIEHWSLRQEFIGPRLAEELINWIEQEELEKKAR